jgi:hypothetical protein
VWLVASSFEKMTATLPKIQTKRQRIYLHKLHSDGALALSSKLQIIEFPISQNLLFGFGITLYSQTGQEVTFQSCVAD